MFGLLRSCCSLRGKKASWRQQQKNFTLKKRIKLAQSDHSLMKGGCTREEREKTNFLVQKPGLTLCLTFTYLVSLFPVSEAGLTFLTAVVAVGVSHCKSSSHFSNLSLWEACISKDCIAKCSTPRGNAEVDRRSTMPVLCL